MGRVGHECALPACARELAFLWRTIWVLLNFKTRELVICSNCPSVSCKWLGYVVKPSVATISFSAFQQLGTGRNTAICISLAIGWSENSQTKTFKISCTHTHTHKSRHIWDKNGNDQQATTTSLQIIGNVIKSKRGGGGHESLYSQLLAKGQEPEVWTNRQHITTVQIKMRLHSPF